MLFNSLDFAIFLPLVFLIYWYVLGKNYRWQNLFIVFASYVFYGWWDWRFLGLILFSTLVDFWMGRLLGREDRKSKRKMWLWVSIVVNIGFLGFFKYYNFFLDNFVTAFSFFGKEFSGHSLKIILPVGISFYTFQTLSYVIDVYRKQLEPSKNVITFAAYVSFFPQLVAGPIERATNLLPQFERKRTFDFAEAGDGMRQILWGLFKKVVIADNCAEFANQIFNNYGDYSSWTLALGAIFFTFQIYGDFSGYSDIAIGTSRLFGFKLMRNFAFPYFSRDIAEFWRRWHISLSTWFRDYLYIPLGGSRGGTWKKIRNTFIIFLVSGFWHGANWTFVIWGGLNALFFLPLLLSQRNRNHLDVVAKGRIFPSGRELLAMIMTFSLTVFAWIFFRAENVHQAFHYIEQMMTTLNGTSFQAFWIYITQRKVMSLLLLIALFLAIEWKGREDQYAIEKFISKWRKPARVVFYYGIIFCIFWFAGEVQQFIYFQF